MAPGLCWQICAAQRMVKGSVLCGWKRNAPFISAVGYHCLQRNRAAGFEIKMGILSQHGNPFGLPTGLARSAAKRMLQSEQADVSQV